MIYTKFLELFKKRKTPIEPEYDEAEEFEDDDSDLIPITEGTHESHAVPVAVQKMKSVDDLIKEVRAESSGGGSGAISKKLPGFNPLDR